MLAKSSGPMSPNATPILRIPRSGDFVESSPSLRIEIAPARTVLAAHTLVGRWRVERELGHGGMASVYLVHDERTGQRAALKVLHSQLARDPSMMRRFVNEARALGLVQHPNVARVYDLVQLQDGSPCIVLEYLEGVTLEQCAGQSPMSAEQALPILLQICDGLAAVHAAGVVHRDLKGENVVLVRTAEGGELAKIFDFGVALVQSDAPATQPGIVVGTPQYMAPEQALGSRADARTDVYAVGVLAHRLLTGSVPFQGLPLEVMRKHLHATPPPLSGVPAPLAEVVRKAMAKQPRERPHDGGELAQALRACAENIPMDPTAPPRTGLPDFKAELAGPHRIRVVFSSAKAFEKINRDQLQHHRLFIPCDLTVESGPLELEIEITGGRRLTLRGELALRISQEQAAIWSSPPGIALTLRKSDVEARPAVAAGALGEDVHREIGRLQVRAGRGTYNFLDVDQDATMAEVTAACGRIQRRIDALAHAADGDLAVVLAALRNRIAHVRKTMADPESRAWHDAMLGNYRGVARCLASGLTSTRLEEMAREWNRSYPERVSKARSLAGVAETHLLVHDRARALDCLQRALEVAPLDGALHHRYWALKRQLSGTVSPSLTRH